MLSQVSIATKETTPKLSGLKQQWLMISLDLTGWWFLCHCVQLGPHWVPGFPSWWLLVPSEFVLRAPVCGFPFRSPAGFPFLCGVWISRRNITLYLYGICLWTYGVTGPSSGSVWEGTIESMGIGGVVLWWPQQVTKLTSMLLFVLDSSDWSQGFLHAKHIL